jgi:hypothetical protein
LTKPILGLPSGKLFDYRGGILTFDQQVEQLLTIHPRGE